MKRTPRALEKLKTGDYSCPRYDTATQMLTEQKTLTIEFAASRARTTCWRYEIFATFR